jgi:hypothetical protein
MTDQTISNLNFNDDKTISNLNLNDDSTISRLNFNDNDKTVSDLDKVGEEIIENNLDVEKFNTVTKEKTKIRKSTTKGITGKEYEIIKKIGQGGKFLILIKGMGEVFLAKNKKNNRVFALKKIYNDNIEGMSQALQEAMSGRIKHDFLVFYEKVETEEEMVNEEKKFVLSIHMEYFDSGKN